MDTYMVDWLGFPFLLYSLFRFRFISVFAITQVNTPCGICHWILIIFFLIILSLSPFPSAG